MKHDHPLGIDPPGIVRPAADIHALIAESELEALMTEARAFGRKTEESAVACGQLLIRVRAQCKHGEFIARLAAHDFTRSTARRLMGMARSKCAKMAHLVGELPISEPDEEEPPAPPPKIQLNTIYCRPCRVSGKPKPNCKACKAKRDEKASLYGPPDPPPAPTPPPDVGDAAESVPADVLLDVDGNALPPIAKVALADRSIKTWVEKYGRPAYDALKLLEGSPGTLHVNIDTLMKRQLSIARMLRATGADPKTIYRCPKCEGAGCERCKQGWLPRGVYLDVLRAMREAEAEGPI